jgi:hypothetical protein
MYIRSYEGLQAFEGLGQLGQNDIDQEITAAKRQIQFQAKRREIAKTWEWLRELAFLKGLKAVYESQAGVPLGFKLHRSPSGSTCDFFTLYPVTKKDAKTGRPGKDNPWRQSMTPERFCKAEDDGSFCLGASRGMAFRTLFGLDKPSNRTVLKDLKTKIDEAKKSGDTAAEAALIISRIVSHSHDPGSVKQFNQDLASRYGIKNTIVRQASRSEAFDALKQGAPIIADLDGGWHWVLVQRSPRGQLWANDPLSGSGVRKTSASELGSRFELIVDASTGDPITLEKADAHKA